MNEVEQRQVASLRRLGVTGRLQMAFSMFDFARELLTTSLRGQHPTWSPEQIHRAWIDRVRGGHVPV